MSRIKITGLSDTIWRSFLTRLEYFNITYNHGGSNSGAAKDPEIDDLLNKCRNADAIPMESLHVAEKRLMPMLPIEVLDADAGRKFEIAAKRNLATTLRLRDRYSGAKSEEEKRALHFELTDAIQYFFVTRVVTREAQQDASRRLNRLAWVLVLPTFLGLALLYLAPAIGDGLGNRTGLWRDPLISSEVESDMHDFLSRYHLFAVMWFGLLGAYFSRLIAFQQRSDQMDRESLESEFATGTILLRLVLGLVGAIIMYLILKAEMIGGTLFPEWEKFQFVDAPTELLSGGAEKVPGTVGGDLGLSADGSIQPPEAQSTAQTITPFQPAASGKEPIRLISKDFAQLLVWSLLAGFSERLIPDRFRSIEETAFAPTSALK